jgi:ATP-dependent DNA helicase RecQ
VVQLSNLLLAYGFKVGIYHAGIPLEIRKQTQALWMKDQLSIIVCTSAFGMGINKGNVRAVIHYDIPSCIEQYYQEAGRAGRDGKTANAILFYQNSDWDYWTSVQQKKYPPIEIIKKAYQDLADFVQLPIGLGEKQEFIFDFEQFCIQFKWDKIIARNALAWIQQEGHVKFSDASFKPSMVQVMADRQSLENFENQHPIPGAVLQTLLRTYGGILDSPRFINEKLVGELLQRDAVFVLKNLHFLSQMGIISFEQKEHQPIVAFQWNRTSASFMKLDYDHYQLMKNAFIKRIDQFSQYIKGQGLDCRSVYLAKYFGEKSPNKCGICDICMTTKK